ncbi:MAG: helix-turn-helix transcriptional regulator [Aeriscardovia sp.]|nr:helix-turn-helix transcriptional regulator [Aeriscardovia sp.]
MRPLQRRLMRTASESCLTENSILFREVLGEVIRSLRTERKETLHDMAEKTGVSLGYLSEVERGKKEASSEVMESISMALGLRLSDTLRLVATALDLNETDRREVLKSGMLRK